VAIVSDTICRCLELLKLEKLGFSHAEIVEELSQKNACSKRTIYNYFEARATWQPILQNNVKPEEVLTPDTLADIAITHSV
jgi:hypothetical protein